MVDRDASRFLAAGHLPEHAAARRDHGPAAAEGARPGRLVAAGPDQEGDGGAAGPADRVALPAAGRLRRGDRRDQPGRGADPGDHGVAVRVVLGEDLTLLRDGLIRLLTAYDMEVVAAVDNGPDLLRALVTHRPDVAVVDVRLPPGFTDEGLKAAIEVLALMAEGRANAGIATRLVVTEKAVSKHINNIFTKLGLYSAEDDNRRVLAVLTYLNA